MLLFTLHMECRDYTNYFFKAMKGRIKELPWRSRKIVFGTVL